jgi:hypothetical protein
MSTSRSVVNITVTCRVGGELVDALDGVDCRFDDVGDVRLHDFRRGAGKDGDDGDHREFDRRQEIHRECLIAKDAEDYQRQHQHDGEDRAANCYVVEIHVFLNR